jgi:hypothetical protein
MIGINEYQQLYGVDRGLAYRQFVVPFQERRLRLLTAPGEYDGTTRRFVRVGRVDSITGQTGFFVPQQLAPEKDLYATFGVSRIDHGDVKGEDTRYIDLWMNIGEFKNVRRRIKTHV